MKAPSIVSTSLLTAYLGLVSATITCDKGGMTSCNNGYGMATLADMEDIRRDTCAYVGEYPGAFENCIQNVYNGKVLQIVFSDRGATEQNCLDAVQEVIDTCNEQEGDFWYTGTYEANGWYYEVIPCPLVGC